MMGDVKAGSMGQGAGEVMNDETRRPSLPKVGAPRLGVPTDFPDHSVKIWH